MPCRYRPISNTNVKGSGCSAAPGENSDLREVISPPNKIATATTIRQKYDAKVFDYGFVNSDWRVHLYSPHGGANQDFYVEEDGAYYKIKIRGAPDGAMSVTDQCLDWGGSKLYMYPCHDGDNQKWYFDGGSGLGENNAATLRVKSEPGMCLDYNDNSLYFNSCHKQGNQLFYFFFGEPGVCSSQANCEARCNSNAECLGYVDMTAKNWGYMLKNYVGPDCLETRSDFVLNTKNVEFKLKKYLGPACVESRPGARIRAKPLATKQPTRAWVFDQTLGTMETWNELCGETFWSLASSSYDWDALLSGLTGCVGPICRKMGKEEDACNVPGSKDCEFRVKDYLPLYGYATQLHLADVAKGLSVRSPRLPCDRQASHL